MPDTTYYLSKVQLDKLYEIKDAYAREELSKLGTVATHNIATAISDGDGKIADAATVKAYVDAQVGSIHKFDVKIYTELPAASADTMYILALVQDASAEAGTYIEYITVENPAGTYSWEAIGSTKTDLSDYVKKEFTIAGIDMQDNITADELFTALGLGALAKKDSAKGTVSGQTISGVKATGSVTGSISVSIDQTPTAATLTKGDYTPAGSVTGSVVAAGSVATEVTNESADAVLAKGDYTPAGNVTVTPATGTVKAVKSVGTQASFTEGAYTKGTAASFTQGAKASWSASVDETTETLSFNFTANGDDTFTPNVPGSKAADTFVANELPVSEDASVVTGITSAAFEGTKEAGLKITGVTYDKATGANSTFTGSSADIAATFAGTETKGALVTAVSYDKSTVNAEGSTFTSDAVSLTVGDIVVTAKEVTVQ